MHFLQKKENILLLDEFHVCVDDKTTKALEIPSVWKVSSNKRHVLKTLKIPAALI